MAQVAQRMFYGTSNVRPVGGDSDGMDGFVRRLHALHDAVEALPLTPENLRVRAKAALAMFGGNPHRDCTTSSSANRLVRQIVRGLVTH